MSSQTLDRRRLLGTAVISALAAELGIVGSARAHSVESPSGSTTTTSAARSAFGAVKRVDAGVLSIGYVEAGPANGAAVILLHGWPYDVRSYAEVVPVLASAGFRVFVPYLRGHGETRFLASDTFRNGQPSALALDTVAFMDALNIPKATIAGFDWGAR